MKNKLAKLLLYIFYFFALFILTIQFGKYFINMSYIEDFILFIPRWLVFSPLILSVFINHRLKKLRLLFISLISLLLIFFYLNYSINIPPIYKQPSQNTIRVMSLNMNGKHVNSRKLNIQIEFNQPNIMVFQESSPQLKKVLPKNWVLNCHQSQCLASKTTSKIIGYQTRRLFGGWGTFAALFELKINGKILYLLNVHLETPRKAYENLRYGVINFSLMKKIYEQRYLEATLAKALAANYSPLVIAGDFNMPNDSWIYNKNFAEFNDAFNKKGFGFGYTKHTTLFGVKIDHILADNNFSVTRSWVDMDIGSDHRPLFADLLFSGPRPTLSLQRH